MMDVEELDDKSSAIISSSRATFGPLRRKHEAAYPS